MTAPTQRRLSAAAVLAGAVLAGAGLMAATAVATAAVPTGLDAGRLDRVDEYLERAREDLGIPGLAFVATDAAGVTHEFVVGTADDDGRALTPRTPFMLASLTKAFTAAAVMRLVESGQLDLDVPVQEYVPWFEVDDPGSSAITPRMLLHHTSGLTRRDGTAYHTGDDQGDDALEDGVRALASVRLASPPGVAYQYSNANYDILGLLVQTISGMPFDAYLARYIYTPLSMEDSYATRDAAREGGLATGYYPWFGSVWRPTYMTLPRAGVGSATTFSSGRDMGRWIAANLNGGALGEGRILSEAGTATLHRPAVEVDPAHAYAMGWGLRPYWEMLRPVDDANADGEYPIPLLVEHAGSWPNAHTYAGMVPSEGWGFALLVNAGDEAEHRLAQLEQNVLQILAGRDATVGPPPVDAMLAGRYVILVLLLVAEIISLLWSIRALWRYGRRPPVEGSGPSRRTTMIGGVAALVLDLFVIWFLLSFAPSRFDVDFAVMLRSAPDVAMLALPLLILAVVWMPIRTVLLVWLDRRRQRAVVASAS